MKKLIISPQAGFGNRLRTLCAGVIIGILTQREIFHYWVKDDSGGLENNVIEMKHLDIYDIFNLQIQRYDGQHADVCFSEWLPHDGWYREQSTAQTKLQCSRVVRLGGDAADIINCDDEVVLIETSLEFHRTDLYPLKKGLMSQIYRDYFPLQPKWKRIIDNTPQIEHGIHIRRGTFLSYFPGSEVSLQSVCDLIDRLHGSKIIFSDDVHFAQMVRRSTGTPLNVTTGASGMEGVENAILEFLILSQCHNIYGTRGSSFSEQAAVFGNRLYNAL